MATLAGNTIASTYPLLLKIDSSGIDGTLRAVEDGDGTDSALSIATDSVLVKGDGVKLYFYDADGSEHISANTAGVLSIAGANEIDLTATAIDINGTVDMSSTVQVGGALTVGANDAGHDVIFYGNSESSNVTWDTSEDDLILNDARLYINQDDAERSLEIVQDGNAQAILIDQNANNISIKFESLATTSEVMKIYDPKNTTAPIFNISDADDLTSGNAIRVHSDSDSTTARELVRIHNDNGAAVNATPLSIVQDAAAHAMKIEQNANDYGLEITGVGNTTIQVLEASGNALTTGAAAYFYSAADRTADFPLVEIQDDNAADGGYGLKVRVDGNGDLIRGMAQGNNNKFVVKNNGTLEISGAIKFPDSQSASSDANSLDDYEEGAWTPQFFDASSGGVQAGVATATGIYVKVGSLVNLTCEINVNSLSGITMGNAVFLRNLPFPTKASTSNMYPPIVVGYATALNISAGVSITGNLDHNGSSYGTLSAFDHAGGITNLSFTELSDNANLTMQMTYRSTS